jgi:hypothetical protein
MNLFVLNSCILYIAWIIIFLFQSCIYVYAYMHACSTYTRQSCLFLLHCTCSTYYTVQAVASEPRPRPAMPRRQPASPGHGQPCPGGCGSQPAQATASHAQAAASQPRPRPAKPWPGGWPSSPGSGQQLTYTRVLKA